MRRSRAKSNESAWYANPDWRRHANGAATFAAFAIAAAGASAAELDMLHGRTMGTTYSVRIWRTDESTGGTSAPDLQRSIDALLARIDEQMSTWRDDSELSRFNSAPAETWVPVSPETAAIVHRSIDVHESTDGAFDVTMGPILQAWGFGPKATVSTAARRAPDEALLRAAQARVGSRHVEARSTPPGLRKGIAGLEIDLSAIAPGYAVDQIVEQLAAAGINNAMVELGGEIRVAGTRPDGSPWRIGVQSPPSAAEGIALVLPLVDAAVATSGDFKQFRNVAGDRFAHIFDPRTGEPLPYRGACVTVVADSCFEADGLATALFVMGPEAGIRWCEQHDVAALYQSNGPDDAMERRASSQFERLGATDRHGVSAE